MLLLYLKGWRIKKEKGVSIIATLEKFCLSVGMMFPKQNDCHLFFNLNN